MNISSETIPRDFFVKVILPIIAVIGLLIILLIGLVVGIAEYQTRVAVEEQSKLAMGALSVRAEHVEKTALDYGHWDDAVQHAVIRPDPEWIDENIGLPAYRNLGFDRTLIIQPDNRPSYIMIGGERLPDPSSQILPEGISALIEKQRALPPEKPTAALAFLDGIPAVVVVASIYPFGDMVDTTRGNRHLLVFIDPIDSRLLNELARIYLLPDLRIVPDQDSSHASVKLSTINGRALTLGWTGSDPGRTLLRGLLPSLVILLGIFAMFSFFVLRHSVAAAKLIRINEQRATHDALTGLPNRTLFFDRLQRSASRKGKFAVLYLDLDGFKSINDTFGHEAGDDVLREVARRLSSCLRGDDMVARLGGDEFAIVLADVADRETINEVATRIKSAIGLPIQLANTSTKIGVTIGVAVAPEHAVDYLELIHKADVALYAGKRSGRQRICFYDPAQDGIGASNVLHPLPVPKRNIRRKVASRQ